MGGYDILEIEGKRDSSLRRCGDFTMPGRVMAPWTASAIIDLFFTADGSSSCRRRSARLTVTQYGEGVRAALAMMRAIYLRGVDDFERLMQAMRRISLIALGMLPPADARGALAAALPRPRRRFIALPGQGRQRATS